MAETSFQPATRRTIRGIGFAPNERTLLGFYATRTFAWLGGLLGFWLMLFLGGPPAWAFLVAIGLSILAYLVVLPRNWYHDQTPQIRRILRIFILSRIAAAATFFYLAVVGSVTVFGVQSDAYFYDLRAQRIATLLATGEPLVPAPSIPGTGTVDLALGLLYSLTAPNVLAATMLWSALGGLGLLVFWLYTRDMTPRHPVAYAAAVLLLPSLMFWTAGIGKDALIMLGIGLIVAGLRCLIDLGLPARGTLYLALGIIAVSSIRPHIALILLASAMFSLLITLGVLRFRGLPSRILVLFTLVPITVVVVAQTSVIIGGRSGESFWDAARERAEVATQQEGGSSFGTAVVTSPLDLPRAVTTSLIRPFLWEARSPLQVLVALEGTLLAVLVAWAIMVFLRGASRPSWSFTLAFCLTYVVLFSAFLASAGNFGILARQRIQVLPFILLALAIVGLWQQPRKAAIASKISDSS